MKKYLVLDYGGSAVKLALMDKEADVLASAEYPAPTASLESLLETARSIAEEYRGEYSGVAVSLPGVIDTRRGIAHTTSPYHCPADTPLAALYSEIYGVPVTIANDGKCAVNAELHKGALKGIQSGAVLALGTGIAGGIVIDGRVWAGTRGAAGELSFFLRSHELLLEAAATASAQKREDTFYEASWEYRASTTGLLRRYRSLKGLSADAVLTGRSFFEAYDAADPCAAEALDAFAADVAVGIFSLQFALDAQRYAIGGGISSRAEVTEKIRLAYEHIHNALGGFTLPEIVPCRYRNGANQIGALMFHLEKEKCNG